MLTMGVFTPHRSFNDRYSSVAKWIKELSWPEEWHISRMKALGALIKFACWKSNL
jgi:hypothetical protein